MSRLLSLLLHDVYRADPAESGFRGAAANRYKLSIEEFEAQLAGLAQARNDLPVLVGHDNEPESGDVRFAITVDDGGLSYYTIVAERLEALGWRGHCFVTTGAIGRAGFLDPSQIRELRERGHAIGSHSVSHPRRFSACRWDDMVREWRESRELLEHILGEEVTIASVPGGAFSTQVARAAREAGLRFLFTSEPETRIGDFAGCTVMGRFTVRAGHRTSFASRLARLEPVPRLREWLIWNAKQRIKSAVQFAVPQRYPQYRAAAVDE